MTSAGTPPLQTAASSPIKNEGKKTLRSLGRVFVDAGTLWYDKKSPSLGAALSYYAVFSLAPTLLVALSVAGLVVGNEAAHGRILVELKTVLGDDAAGLVQTMLAKSSEQKAGIIGTIVGLVTLFIGATAVMVELQSTLDTLWDVKGRNTGLHALVKERILSFGLVLSVGFLLVVSLLASAAMVAVSTTLGSYVPGAILLGVVLNNLVSFGVLTLFFALIYRYLPNARIAWSDVWIGGLLTSALFQLGRMLIALYIGKAGVSSTFGAAGSLAVLLVWVYYSSQIVLMGAAVTRRWAEKFGKGIAEK